MYVCMYVCMHVHIYICINVCIYVSLYEERKQIMKKKWFLIRKNILTCPSRTSRCPTQPHVQRSCKSHVAQVCERCNDQTGTCKVEIHPENKNHHNGSRMQINLIFDLNDRIFIILRVKALSLTVAYTVRKYT